VAKYKLKYILINRDLKQARQLKNKRNINIINTFIIANYLKRRKKKEYIEEMGGRSENIYINSAFFIFYILLYILGNSLLVARSSS